ncbi:MAG: hypothetical protein LBN95_02760 [Prevotellaceae bacterium]|nr:hypothetical protein [Prevotellaceae bacterium]
MLTILKFPPQYSFASNPMPFLCQVSSIDEVVNIRITIRRNQYSMPNDWFLYQNSFKFYPYKKINQNVSPATTQYLAEFDISSICKDFAENLIPFENTYNGVMQFKVEFLDNNGATLQTKQNYFIKGGISLENFIDLQADNKNIFDERFFNIDAQFIFTTRIMANNTLIFRKSELSNIYFYTKYPNYKYQLAAGSNVISIGSSLQANNYFRFCNLKEIYDQLAPADNRISMQAAKMITANPNFTYDVFEEKFAIQVLDDPAAEEKHIVEFRNSIGVLERILLTGEPQDISEFADTKFYQTNENNFLQNKFLRGSKREKIKVSTGYRLSQEIAFIQDLLLSDEVYMIDQESGTKRPCKISAEDFTWKYKQNLPEAIALNIDFLNDENFYIGDTQLQDINNLQDNYGNNILDNEGEQITI